MKIHYKIRMCRLTIRANKRGRSTVILAVDRFEFNRRTACRVIVSCADPFPFPGHWHGRVASLTYLSGPRDEPIPRVGQEGQEPLESFRFAGEADISA